MPFGKETRRWCLYNLQHLLTHEDITCKEQSCPASHHQNTESTHTSYLAYFAFGFLHCHPVSSSPFVYLLFLLLLFMVNSAGELKEKNTTVSDGGALVLYGSCQSSCTIRASTINSHRVSMTRHCYRLCRSRSPVFASTVIRFLHDFRLQLLHFFDWLVLGRG